ncbi:MAG: hypothetical protein KAH32_04485 [Chlamydiia bacterium]|nr:hypothetical protein [Chlamydiia bacterium]
MTNGLYITFEEMMYRIRRHPLLEDALKSDIALDVYEVLRKVGAPGVYTDERIVVNISDYIGDLPGNILYINEVNIVTGDNVELPMQYVIGNKKSKWHCSNARDLKIRSEYGYSINPGKIHTDIKDGQVVLYYKSVAMDDLGFPMIPDDPALISAITAYVKLKHFEIKVDLGLLPQHVLSRVEQEYYFTVAQAETRFKMPNPAEYNSIARSLLRIVKGLEYKQ